MSSYLESVKEADKKIEELEAQLRVLRDDKFYGLRCIREFVHSAARQERRYVQFNVADNDAWLTPVRPYWVDDDYVGTYLGKEYCTFRYLDDKALDGKVLDFNVYDDKTLRIRVDDEYHDDYRHYLLPSIVVEDPDFARN